MNDSGFSLDKTIFSPVLASLSLFPIAGCLFPGWLVCFYYLTCLCLIEIPVFNANSVEPDQMPCSVASDLDLHCLPITHLGVSRLE